jgi:hypothetical protein
MEERAQCAVDPYPILREEGSVNYQISIIPLNYGYIVEVGCQRFAVGHVENLIERISAYLRNPREVITQWNESKTLPAQ